MSRNAAEMAVRMKPTTNPTRAVTIGSPIATTEPKVRSRISTAAAIPINSDSPGTDISVFVITWPPASIRSPSPSDESINPVRASTLSAATSLAPTAYWTVA